MTHCAPSHRSSALASLGLALACALPTTAFAAEPQWLGGPWTLDASPARNPAVAAHGDQIHVVYRVRSGGIGHITGPSMGMPTSELVIPGSVETAAVTRAWNFPKVAVDQEGAGHVVWGPLSTEPQKGTWYARIDADGVPVVETRQLTSRWVEDVDVATVGDQVHVVVNAIGDAPGVFDWSGSVTTGPTVEQSIASNPTMRELSLQEHDGGIAAIGRFTKLGRTDLGPGHSWSAVQLHDGPGAPFTSLGFPRMLADEPERWAAMGWIDATPTAVVARRNGSWTTLSVEPPFDPIDADGGSPAVAMARDPQGRVAVAWLSASGDRLRMALADPEWSAPVALPGTADATSFDLCADVEGFRVVFVTDDGTLHTGRLGVPSPPPAGEDEEPDDGGDETGGEEPGGEEDTDGADEPEDTEGSGDGDDGLDDDAYEGIPVAPSEWTASRADAGCGCRSAPGGGPAGLVLPWLGLWLLAGRRRKASATLR